MQPSSHPQCPAILEASGDELEQSGGLDRPFQKVKPCSVGVMLQRGTRYQAKGHRTTQPSPYDLRSCLVVEVDSYDDDSTPCHGQG